MSKFPNLEKIRVVALDWDGTIVDSIPYKIAQNQAIAAEFGNNLTVEQVRSEWNAANGFTDLLYRLTGSPNTAEVMQVVKRDYDNPAYAKRSFAFAQAALAALRAEGFQLGIITNATREILSMDMATLGIEAGNDFSFSQAADECDYKKPDARVFDMLLQYFDVQPHQMLYIGDELKDSLAAQNAGAEFIGVTTGMTTADEFDDHGIAYAENLAVIAASLRSLSISARANKRR